MHVYQTVVRPVLEYACPAWRSSLTKEQSKSLPVDTEHHTFQIIVGNIQYKQACNLLDVSLLAGGLLGLCSKLFRQIASHESLILHYLLPMKCDSRLTG